MDARGGAVAGAVATLPMSAVLLVGRAVGMPGPVPPVLLARRIAPSLRAPLDRVLGAALHVGIGAASGALAAPVVVGPRSGAVFGLAIWAAGYLLVMPALGVVPPAPRDRRGRQVPLLVAHSVYGVALGVLAVGPSARGRG